MATNLWDNLVNEVEKIVTVAEEAASIFFGSSTDGNGATEASSPDVDVSDIFGGESAEAASNDHGSTILDTADQVLRDALSGSVGPQNFREHIAAFTSAITWKEPFICCLLMMHVIIIIMAIMCSRKKYFAGQVATFALVAGLVWSTEWLNTYGAEHWREFATQNYFDAGGVFAGIMFAVPLILICLGMIIDMLREASLLLVQVKKLELKNKNMPKKSAGSKRSGKATRKSKKED